MFKKLMRYINSPDRMVSSGGLVVDDKIGNSMFIPMNLTYELDFVNRKYLVDGVTYTSLTNIPGIEYNRGSLFQYVLWHIKARFNVLRRYVR